MSWINGNVLFFAGFRLALVQLTVGSSKAENLQNAVKRIAEAATGGANVVTLPVSFDLNTHYDFIAFNVFTLVNINAKLG